MLPDVPAAEVSGPGRGVPLAAPRGRPALLATALTAAGIGLTVGALSPALPTLHTHLHTPLADLGILFSANFGGSVLSALLLGGRFDRRSGRDILVAGIALMILGMLALPLATSLPQAVAALALIGVGSGTNSAGVPVLTARLFGARGGRALSLVNMCFGLGAFVGPLVMAAALERTHQYGGVFAGIAALLLLPLALYLLVPLPVPRPLPHGRAPRLPATARPAVALLAAIAFLYLGAEVGFGGWLYTFVRESTSADPATASWAPATFWLALSIGSLLVALLPLRVAPARIVFWCALCAGAVLALLLGLGSVIGIAIGLAGLLGLLLGPIYPLTLAEAADLVPAAAGRVASVVTACSQVGGAVLPWAQGLLLARGTGWGIGTTLAACLALSLLQAVLLRRLLAHHPQAGRHG